MIWSTAHLFDEIYNHHMGFLQLVYHGSNQTGIGMYQEGSQQTIGEGSTCSNDDVIKSMTSLLLPYSAQKVGGQLTPLTPQRLPP